MTTKSYITSNAISTGWRNIPVPPVPSLASARLRLHWGSQIPCAAASQLIEPLPDYSHCNLTYNANLNALLSRPLPKHKDLSAGLVLTECSLLVTDKKFQPLASKPLAGLTLEEGMKWMASALKEYGGDVPPLVRPFQEIPASPIANKEPFPDGDPAGLAEVDRWFANSFSTLLPLAKSLKSSTVWCWPHHFDVATLLFLEDKPPDKAQQINIGFSPGDGNFDHPYWYVTFWPDSTEPLPPLEGQGIWCQEAFKGALLLTDHLAISDQPEQLAAYLNSAIGASIKLVG